MPLLPLARQIPDVSSRLTDADYCDEKAIPARPVGEEGPHGKNRLEHRFSQVGRWSMSTIAQTRSSQGSHIWEEHGRRSSDWLELLPGRCYLPRVSSLHGCECFPSWARRAVLSP